MAACRPTPATNPEEAQRPDDRSVEVSDIFPDARGLATGPEPLHLVSHTTITVTRGSSTIKIDDEKELWLRMSGSGLSHGDFHLHTVRSHKDSEAGDTEESFTAIMIGKDYWTRGSGGPFVLWDDALDEPNEALRLSAGETHSLLALLMPCLSMTRDSNDWVLSLANPDCTVSTGPDSTPMTVVFRSFTGEVSWSGERPGKTALQVQMDVMSNGHGAAVEVVHEATVGDLPQDHIFIRPEHAISSRRERPVKMIKEVLSGLVEGWGPGAPDVLKE